MNQKKAKKTIIYDTLMSGKPNPNDKKQWSVVEEVKKKVNAVAQAKAGVPPELAKQLEESLQKTLEVNDAFSSREIIEDYTRLEIPLPSLPLLTKLLSIYESGQNWLEIQSLWRPIKASRDLKLNSETGLILLRSFNTMPDSTKHLVKVAQRLLDDKATFTEEMFKIYFDAMKKNGTKDYSVVTNRVFKLFEANKVAYPTEYLETLVEAAGKTEDYPNIGSKFHLMLEKKHKPSAIAYQYRILLAYNLHQAFNTFKVFREMKTAGHKPDQKTYEIVIRTVGISKEPISKVDEYINEFKADGNEINSGIYDAAIYAVSKRGEIDKAVEYLNFMKNNNLRWTPRTCIAFLPYVKKYHNLDEELGRKTSELIIKVRLLTGIRKYGNRHTNLYQPYLDEFDTVRLQRVITMLPKYTKRRVEPDYPKSTLKLEQLKAKAANPSS